MKKIIIVLFLFSKTIYAQEKPKVNSIGFGLGNTISLFLKNSDFNKNGAFDTITGKPSFFIDYTNKSDSIKHFRLNIISEFPEKVDDIKTFYNFFLSMGIEKDLPFIKSQKINIYYGSDIYYKTNLVKSKLTPWSLFSHGFGFIGLIGFNHYINNDFSINSEFNVGLGYHQNQEGLADPNTGRILLERKFVSNKNFSIGLRKSF